MAKDYDYTDLTWSLRGDIVLGHDKDIMDTFDDPLRSIVQELRTRVMGDIADWYFAQDICAAINDFVGEPNNKVTAEGIKTRIKTAAAKYGLVANRDLTISYLPFDVDKIIFRLTLQVAPTARNGASEEVSIQFLYSYSENNCYPMPRS